MKKIIGLLIVLMMMGCLQPEVAQPTKEELANELASNVIAPPLITVSGNENLSVVTMRAVDTSSGWQFPLSDYNDEFINVGLYSDSFIKLNKSQIPWLEDGEAIWLTPMLRNGTGTLFNAIYSKEIDNCNATTLTILGKEYRMSELEYGGRFENDDKWQVGVLEEMVEPPNMTEEQQRQYDLSSYREFCPRRVVIYLDGYFYDIKEGDQVNLFRNDNTILFQFKDLAGEPKAEVVATRPIGKRALPPVAGTSVVADASIGKNYTLQETINQSGLYLKFEPAIPVCTREECTYNWRWGLTERDRLILNIADENWVISDLEKNDSTEEVAIAKEKEHGILHTYGCEGAAGMEEGDITTIDVNGDEWGMADLERKGLEDREILFKISDETAQISVGEGETFQSGTGFIHIWVIAPGDPICAKWSEVSVFSDVVSLSAPESNVTLVWEDETSDNQALKSIFVPATSPIFEKLTGEIDS